MRPEGAAGSPAAGLVEQVTTPTEIAETPTKAGDFVYGVFGGTEREAVANLNRKRRIRRLRTCVPMFGDVVQATMPGHDCIMVTLTYASDWTFEVGQLSKALEAMKAYASRRGVTLRGVWVLEATKRGRPHYHVLLWVPRGFRLPPPDKRGWWPWGMTRIEKSHAPVGYLSKYASKGSDATFPPGARLFGVFGLQPHFRKVITWARRPRWLRRISDPGQPIVRVPFVGWVDASSGEVWQTPYRVKFEPWVNPFNGQSCVLVSVELASGSEDAEHPSALNLPPSRWGLMPNRWRDRVPWLKATLAELSAV